MGYFSVLIPVYNAKKYLQECVLSVLGQTFRDFEIILVDDGSDDGSAEVCDEFSLSDSRIKAVHQKNQGPLPARIRAFFEAKGDFVIYMDADDCWDRMLLEKAKEAIDCFGCDIVSFRWQYMDAMGNLLEKIPSLYPSSGTVYEIECLITKFLTEETENSLWKRAVRRSCVSSSQIAALSEMKNIYLGEDMLQSFVMIKDCESMVYLDEAFYFYRMNEQSLTHNATWKSVIDIAKAREYLWRILKQSRFNQSFYQRMLEKSFMEHYLTDLVGIAVQHKVKMLKQIAFEIRQGELYKEAKNHVGEYGLPLRRKLLYHLEQREQWNGFWCIARLYSKFC